LPFFLKHTKLRSARTVVYALVAQMQWYCRAIVCEDLAQSPSTVTVSDKAQTRILRVTGRAL